jgi:hypothetical protein
MSGFYEFSDLKVGMRVNVEGAWQPDGSLRAHMLAIKDDGDADELEGTVAGVDVAGSSLEILGLRLAVNDEVEIKDVDKRVLQLAAVRPGMRVKSKGKAGPAGQFAPEKIKVKLPTPDAMDEIESEITAIDPRAHTLTVMGFQVVCGPDVEIEA